MQSAEPELVRLQQQSPHLLAQRHGCHVRRILAQLSHAQQQPAHQQRHAAHAAGRAGRGRGWWGAEQGQAGGAAGASRSGHAAAMEWHTAHAAREQQHRICGRTSWRCRCRPASLLHNLHLQRWPAPSAPPAAAPCTPAAVGGGVGSARSTNQAAGSVVPGWHGSGAKIASMPCTAARAAATEHRHRHTASRLACSRPDCAHSSWPLGCLLQMAASTNAAWRGWEGAGAGGVMRAPHSSGTVQTSCRMQKLEEACQLKRSLPRNSSTACPAATPLLAPPGRGSLVRRPGPATPGASQSRAARRPSPGRSAPAAEGRRVQAESAGR